MGRYLSVSTLREVLLQAVLPTPIFTSRWRWNLSRSLVSPRFRGARHLPPAIQRMEADDLMAAVFPALAACQENVTGPIEIPDHPLVRQTLDDCCTEAMDLAALTDLVGKLRGGEVALPLRGGHRGVGPLTRDPERPSLHLLRRRPSKNGALTPSRCDAAYLLRPMTSRASTPRSCVRSPRRLPATRATLMSCTTC